MAVDLTHSATLDAGFKSTIRDVAAAAAAAIPEGRTLAECLTDPELVPDGYDAAAQWEFWRGYLQGVADCCGCTVAELIAFAGAAE